MGATIGRKIKELRLSNDLTQEQLGKILGVNKSAVQKYEAGDVKNLKRETIVTLCNHFRVYPYIFLFEPGEYWIENEYSDLLASKYFAETNLISEKFTDVIGRSFTLTDEGFQKVLEYIDDLNQIEKYKRRP